jgi:hypothetical protein
LAHTAAHKQKSVASEITVEGELLGGVGQGLAPSWRAMHLARGTYFPKPQLENAARRRPYGSASPKCRRRTRSRPTSRMRRRPPRSGSFFANGQHNCGRLAVLSCTQDAELLQRGCAIVQADFLGDLAILQAKHCRSREPHFPARGRRKGADKKVAEGGAGVRAASFPAADDIVILGMRSATPQNLRSGNARRNSVMNFFTSSRPRRGACSEYCKRMSGALSSSTTLGFQGLPQNSLNHRATTALFSCSFDIGNSFSLSLFAPLRSR